ncbi:leukocyte elastase inhibitor-like [Clarias magur]|uniref:Leukocyte elastase inhibitor-like n=1 Tax=Clarias magur TaxID=1594786 RepID=A0A8J4U9X8_CLAMG|nr:leukocyte elastase inhibitor-like [Clarias magur]
MDRLTDIIAYLPIFMLEEQYSLTGILSKMGTSSLFQAGATDLTGMSRQEERLIFVLSVTHKAFVELESELTVDKLTEWTNPERMDRSSDIVLHLPKFKLEEQYSLTDILSKMDMSYLFQAGAADLTGMSSQKDLFVSFVIHKAFFKVNEEGTEAAAATTCVVVLKCWRPVKHFLADRPFIFFIRHNPTKSILFLGKFRGPQ